MSNGAGGLPTIPGWLFYAVTLTIVGLWATGIILTFASASFQMPESLNGALPIVLVALYTTKAAGDRRRGGNDDREDDNE